MTDTIQPLLERIQQEGLKKSEAEKAEILAAAKTRAEEILTEARSEAEKIRRDAEKDAEATRARGITALEQAARDLLLQLRTELARQLNVAAGKAASASLNSEELLRQILPLMARSGSGKVQVEAGSELAGRLETLLPALLKDAGREGEVVMNPKSGAGFKLQFDGSPEAVDFSAQAVADWLGQHLRPELAALLKADSTGE